NRVYALAVPQKEIFVALGYTYPEGKTVARGRLATGQREVRLGSLEGVLRFAALASGGRRLAVGPGARHAGGGRGVEAVRPVAAAVSALSIAPAGDTLAVAHGEAINWWNVERGRGRLLEGHAGEVRGLAFSPGGQLLGSAGLDGRVMLWHTSGWTPVSTFDWGLGPLRALAFSPDGMTAAAAGEAGRIVVWDVEEG